jgi:hypothetical protein
MWFHILEFGNIPCIGKVLSSFASEQQTEKNKSDIIAYTDIILNDYLNKHTLNIYISTEILLYYFYSLWKLYKKREVLDRSAVMETIKGQYGLGKFFLFYPVYKIYKPYLKLKRRVVRP